MQENNLDIEDIFKQHYKDLCHIAFNYLQNVKDAEDVVQEKFIALLHNKKLNEITNIKSYLWQSIKNACINKLEREKKLYRLEESYFTNYKSVSKEEEMIRLEQQLYLHKQIDLLPKQCKKVFLKCIIDGESYKETSKDLEISVNAVKNQMKRAYKILRKSLNNHYVFSLFIKKYIFRSTQN
ncbi:RNA polymerase sigma factor [Flavivirga spongiicola]|uniref:Sigma-70 family RNA polymerase sigma factor n=1 Tax=Flavivirga spongiicola TaxID=421621 RepID=A0ABU7XPD7_9FLAO|nr:sigma-70 family RNA polymerase sigma factor [Flavivirga sp. MEBiC05379]MDO5981396.1 sigma-70 family RNA polymerase sigma factor [Flavivirga sp. MEBiC05379]